MSVVVSLSSMTQSKRMTLIITELSEFGIAMVADSAVTITEVTPSGDTTK